MGKGFEAETLIAADPEAVWAVMTDFARSPEWMPGIEAVEPRDDGPLAAGKVFAVTMTTKGRGRERDMTLAQWRPPHAFALSSQEGGVTATYTYSLKPNGRGTRVTLHGACEATGLWRLLHPLIVKMMAKHDSRQMEMLKAVVEGGRQ